MKKKVVEKFKTKLNNFLRNNEDFTLSKNQVLFNNQKIFSFKEINNDLILLSYTKIGVNPRLIDPVYHIEYELKIYLDQVNLNFLSSNLSRPLKYIPKLFGYIKSDFTINEINFGGSESKFVDGICYVSSDFYNNFKIINDEESAAERIRIKTRSNPFFKKYYNKEFNDDILERDYGVILNEIITSGNLTDDAIMKAVSQLKPGKKTEVVINEKIEEQTEWLLGVLRKIIDTPRLNKTIARDFGNRYFHYSKNSITGPEHLLEKILSDYGKNIIFGVPALLNTDKYVVSERIKSKVQFDIILVDELSDVQIVELKKPDEKVLEFEQSRNKFFPSKNLSIAIGQSERYISTILRENDEEYKIEGKKIREYIEKSVSGVTELFITRPTALIVVGRIQDLAKRYEKQGQDVQKKIKKNEYEKNLLQAYRELRSTHKNIKIITYSELINGAELRLKHNIN